MYCSPAHWLSATWCAARATAIPAVKLLRLTSWFDTAVSLFVCLRSGMFHATLRVQIENQTFSPTEVSQLPLAVTLAYLQLTFTCVLAHARARTHTPLNACPCARTRTLRHMISPSQTPMHARTHACTKCTRTNTLTHTGISRHHDGCAAEVSSEPSNPR